MRADITGRLGGLCVALVSAACIGAYVWEKAEELYYAISITDVMPPLFELETMALAAALLIGVSSVFVGKRVTRHLGRLIGIPAYLLGAAIVSHRFDSGFHPEWMSWLDYASLGLVMLLPVAGLWNLFGRRSAVLDVFFALPCLIFTALGIVFSLPDAWSSPDRYLFLFWAMMTTAMLLAFAANGASLLMRGWPRAIDGASAATGHATAPS